MSEGFKTLSRMMGMDYDSPEEVFDELAVRSLIQSGGRDPASDDPFYYFEKRKIPAQPTNFPFIILLLYYHLYFSEQRSVTRSERVICDKVNEFLKKYTDLVPYVPKFVKKFELNKAQRKHLNRIAKKDINLLNTIVGFMLRHVQQMVPTVLAELEQIKEQLKTMIGAPYPWNQFPFEVLELILLYKINFAEFEEQYVGQGFVQGNELRNIVNKIKQNIEQVPEDKQKVFQKKYIELRKNKRFNTLYHQYTSLQNELNDLNEVLSQSWRKMYTGYNRKVMKLDKNKQEKLFCEELGKLIENYGQFMMCLLQNKRLLRYFPELKQQFGALFVALSDVEDKSLIDFFTSCPTLQTPLFKKSLAPQMRLDRQFLSEDGKLKRKKLRQLLLL